MFKIVLFVSSFFFLYPVYGDSYEFIPEAWSYECSEKHDEYYGYPCVLKNEHNRIVFASLSESVNLEQGRLLKSFRYKTGYGDDVCRLWYVQPKPFMFKGPKSYIVDKDWIIVRALGAVDSAYCAPVEE